MRSQVIALSEILRVEGCELPLRARLRVALDVCEGLPGELGPFGVRAPTSGMVPTRVTIGRDGRARLAASPRNASGALVLLWEIVAGRYARGGMLDDLREILDDPPMDLVEVLDPANADCTDEQLRERFERAAAPHAGTHEEVARALVVVGRKVERDGVPGADRAAWDKITSTRIKRASKEGEQELPLVMIDAGAADPVEAAREARLGRLEANARWAETVKIVRPISSRPAAPQPQPRSPVRLQALAFGLLLAVVVVLVLLRFKA